MASKIRVVRSGDAVRAAVRSRRGRFTADDIRDAIGRAIGEACVRYHLKKMDDELVKVGRGVYERRYAS